MGNRWKKEVRETYPGISAISNKYTSTYYIRDAQGNVLSTYKRIQTPSNATNPDNFYWEEAHIYGSSRVGVEKVNVHLVKKGGFFIQPIYAVPNVKNTKIRGKKRYELSNHLGNVLTVIGDHRIVNKTGSVVNYYEAVIISAQDYYPFGSVMPKRSTQLYVNNNNGNTSYRNEYDNNTNWTPVDLYRYGFNGKELDSDWESGTYDYGFRIYDARISRFLSVDPLTTSFPMLTPYQFAGNMPICAIDLDGLEQFIVVKEFTRSQNGQTQTLTRTTERNVGVKLFGKEIKGYNFTLNGREYRTNSNQTTYGRDGLGVNPGIEGNFSGVYTLTEDDLATLFAYGLDVIDRYGSIDDAYISESVGDCAELDFKFTLYSVLNVENNMLIEIDGIVHNANEAGNFIWGALNEYADDVTDLDAWYDPSFAAQAKTLWGDKRRDEPWEQKAIDNGENYGIAKAEDDCFNKKVYGKVYNKEMFDDSYVGQCEE